MNGYGWTTCPCASQPSHSGGDIWEALDKTNPITIEEGWFPVCDKHKSLYEILGFEVRPKTPIEYKCFANAAFGPHEGPEIYETKNPPYHDWFPICEKHALGKPYGEGSWTVRKMDGGGQPTPETFKFDDPHKHQEVSGNTWWCSKPAESEDGTRQHFGNCYKLTPSVFVCDNHVGFYMNQGKYKVDSYGPKDHFIKVKAGDIVLLPIFTSVEKYDSAYKHKEATKNYWYCEGDNSFGLDGTTQHWGMTFKIRHPIKGTNFICENHTPEFEAAGYVKISYGTEKETKIQPGDVVPQTKPKAPGMITREKIAGGWSIRTQKAKGMDVLRKAHFPIPKFKVYDAKDCEPSTLVGFFVRPCPMRPRHGFVDSRSVNNTDEAQALITETLVADPEAEFVCMPHIPAEFSGIWTPGHLAIGLGTDGATAGKTAVTIPMLGDLLDTVKSHQSSSLRTKAGIESAPYVELLWKKEDVGATIHDWDYKFVQLRDGPKLPENMVDYIPESIKVENIIVADGDLLAWEGKMRETLPQGTVVYHPGGSMASHYAIHAVLNHVPLLISREPKIGDILEPTQASQNEPNIQAMRAGFAMACEIDMNYPTAAFLMLLGCHSTAIWTGKQDLLLGAAMGTAWRLSVAAALGEARHHGGKGKRQRSRGAVYRGAWKKSDTQYFRVKFTNSLDLFLNGDQWPRVNFGGKSWYKFVSNAAVMYNALITKEPAKALEALNQLVHSAHNSGWGFDKFIEQKDLGMTAANPVYSAVRCAPILYQLLTADTETLKSAARTFWKRYPIEIPVDRGTGGHMEPSDDESCSCSDCKNEKKRQQNKFKKPHEVIAAQVKLVPENGSLHFQWKSNRMHGKEYFTKDLMFASQGVKDLIPLGEKTTSFNGNLTEYTKLVKGISGWYLPNGPVIDGEIPLGSHILLNLEETPNG